MKKGYQIVLLSLVVLLTTAQNISQLQCSVSSASSPVKLGQAAVVCLHFVINEPSNETITYAFKTTVDTFSALTVKGLAADKLANLTDVTVYLQYQNIDKTTPMLMLNATKGIYRQVFSFVVSLKDGEFSKFSLDNAGCDVCETSNKQVCDSSTGNECYSSGGKLSSDPVFYISWIGTDSSGNNMLSYTKRLSRFYQYSIGSIYQKAKSLVNKLL